MATLYVDEQGAMVRKRDQQIIVTKNGKLLQEVPLNKIDRVVLMGKGVQLTTALHAELLERGISVMITNRRGSRPYGAADGGPSRLINLRMQQMLRITDPAWSLELAQSIVRGKLANQRTVLQRSGWPAALTAIPQIERAGASLPAATDLDVVRGLEGTAAAAYFGAWRTVFEGRWGFGGRAYYPPPDPVNAALSFGYTLLFHDVLTAVQTIGLDQYLGVFHAVEDGRPSLALDLMEEFRPLIVDTMVVELLGDGQLNQTHFERPVERPQAIHLNEAGRAIYIERYETVMLQLVRVAPNEQTTRRRVLRLQAQALARVIRGEQERYTAYTGE